MIFAARAAVNVVLCVEICAPQPECSPIILQRLKMAYGLQLPSGPDGKFRIPQTRSSPSRWQPSLRYLIRRQKLGLRLEGRCEQRFNFRVAGCSSETKVRDIVGDGGH